MVDVHDRVRAAGGGACALHRVARPHGTGRRARRGRLLRERGGDSVRAERGTLIFMRGGARAQAFGGLVSANHRRVASSAGRNVSIASSLAATFRGVPNVAAVLNSRDVGHPPAAASAARPCPPRAHRLPHPRTRPPAGHPQHPGPPRRAGGLLPALVPPGLGPLRGMGLRPDLPQRSRTRRRLPRLAIHLQPPRPHRTRRHHTSQPRHQPVGKNT